MSKLALTITQAGQARYAAAQLGGDIDLSVARVGLTDRAFVAAPTLTALPGEFRRVDTLSGKVVGDNVVHLVVRDSEAGTYTVRGFGLFLADGTLFATYAQSDVLFQKATLSDMHLAIDIAFPITDVQQLTFGDTSFLNPPATTVTKGIAALATQDQVDTGTDADRIVTPKTLAQRLLSLLSGRKILGGGLASGGGDLSADRTITVPAATAAQLVAATAGDAVLTPKTFSDMQALFGSGDNLIVLPGGWIVQLINYRALLVDEPLVTIQYPVAFPNRCVFAIAGAYISAASAVRDGAAQVCGEPGRTSCMVQVQADDQNDRRIDGINLLVIGR